MGWLGGQSQVECQDIAEVQSQKTYRRAVCAPTQFDTNRCALQLMARPYQSSRSRTRQEQARLRGSLTAAKMAPCSALTSNEPHPGHPKTIYRYMQTST